MIIEGIDSRIPVLLTCISIFCKNILPILDKERERFYDKSNIQQMVTV